MNMPCGNTAALNAYLLEQEQRDREFSQDDLDMERTEKAVAKIKSDSEAPYDAISPESARKLQGLIIEFIECRGTKSANDAARELGEVYGNMVFDYIAPEEI